MLFYGVIHMNDFMELLKKLEDRNIYFQLNRTRDNTIMIEVAVPGQRWEIEYCFYDENSNGTFEIEKFVSDGTIYDKSELDVLFRDFSD